MIWFRWTLAGLLVAMGLLAVFRAPHGALWKPAVGATAFGLWLVPLAMFVTWTGGPDGPGLVAGFGALLLTTPWLRAALLSEDLQRPVIRVFGDQPWSGPAPARPAPPAIGLVFSPGAAGPEPTTHTFEPDHGLTLDLYPGAGPGPHPVVIAVHGGSWNKGDASQLPAINRYLAARGITVAAITYRLAPAHTFPAHAEDVASAIAWMRAQATQLDTDPERTVLLGRSAGGHLALLAAYTTEDPGIRGVVSLYGPTDMRWSWDHPTHPWILDTPGTLGEFLGGAPDAVGDTYDAASPLQFVGPGSPPTLLFHGTRDELVFAEQSHRLAAELARHGVPHALVETAWDTHGFDAHLGGPGGQFYVWALERFLFHRFSNQ